MKRIKSLEGIQNHMNQVPASIIMISCCTTFLSNRSFFEEKNPRFRHNNHKTPHQFEDGDRTCWLTGHNHHHQNHQSIAVGIQSPALSAPEMAIHCHASLAVPMFPPQPATEVDHSLALSSWTPGPSHPGGEQG